MKTAEEWMEELGLFNLCFKEAWIVPSIESIQLDAFKAGMEYAANVAVRTVNHYHPQGLLRTREQTEQQILTTATTLKELPK